MEKPIITKYPTKPTLKSKKSKKITKKVATTNNYTIKLIHSKSKKQLYILSWSISLGEDIPLDARLKYYEAVKTHKNEIKSKIGFFSQSGQKIYSIGNPNSIEEKQMKFKAPGEDGLVLEMNLNKNAYDLVNLSPNESENYEIIKFLNLIVKDRMQKMGLKELGYNKKYYDNKPHQLEIGDFILLILIGMISSIGLNERGITMNLDYNLRITRYYNLWEETVFIKEQGKKLNDIIDNNIIGKSFILMHANHRIIRVDKVDRKMKITDAFPNKKFKNYIDYFQKRYKYELKDKDQFFCVQIEKNYKIAKNIPKNLIKKDKHGKEYIEQENYYPSELLRPTGMLDEQKRNFKVMKQFAKYTQLYPNQRFEKIEGFINDFNKNDQKAKNKTSAKAIDINDDIKLFIEEKENQVEAKLLDYPKLECGDRDIKPNPKNGNYIMKNKIYSKGVKINNYALIFDKFQERNVKSVIQNLKKCSKAFGIQVKDPSVKFQIDSRNVDPSKLLNKIWDKNEDIDMVLFVVGNKNRIYNSIKAYFSRQGVATQFYTNVKSNLSISSNILLQKSSKKGAVLWQVEDAFEGKKNMNCLIGIDVIQTRQGLVITLCATTDRKFSQLFSIFDIVKKSTKKNTRERIAETISGLYTRAQARFFEINNCYPDNTVVYRVGSGNSSGLDEDLKYEAILCKEEIKRENPNSHNSNLIYFAVSRQITERIFEQDGRGNAKNPRGGLIVSNGITRKNRFEFYMVAQNVNQGSATPTHYSCVFNDTSFSEDEILKTTYYQTFNYANWRGPVKVPGVAMNAIKLSQFWADNLKHRNIKVKAFESDLPYFL